MNGPDSIEFEPIRGWEAASQRLPVWEELARATGLWLPFQEPGWSAAWWRHWSRRDALRSDEFVLWLGRDRAGVVRALLPSVLSTLPGRGLQGVRVLGALGRDPNVTELQPVVCRTEDAVAAHAGLLRSLRERQGEWDAFRWTSVPANAAVALRPTRGVELVRRVSDYMLQAGGGWTGFATTMPRNVKEAIRKARNAPRRAGLEFCFRVLRKEAEIAAVLPDFTRLHAARARTQLVPSHANVFASERARSFLADVMAELSRTGIALVFALFHDERLVACRLAFRMRETLYLYYSGWDPAYAPYSVMTRTLVDGMRWAIENGVRVINLSTGTDMSKTRWRPSSVEYQTLWQWAPSIRGRLARLTHLWAGHDRRF